MKNLDLPTIDLPQRVGGKRVLSFDELVETYKQKSNRLPPFRPAFSQGNSIDLDMLVDKGIITEDIKDAITTIVAYEGGYFNDKRAYDKARMKFNRFMKTRAPILAKCYHAGLLPFD